MPAPPRLRVFGRLDITAPPLWLIVAMPLGYFAAAVLSIAVFGTNTPVWVSNALAVTAMLRHKRSTWPVLLGLAALADYAATALMHNPLIAIGLTPCDCLEIFLITALSGFTCDTSLDGSIWPLARLAAACLVAPAVSALGGAALITLAYGAPFLAGWKTWYLGTACGELTVTPLLLSWTDRTLQTRPSRNAIFQTLGLSVLVAVVGYVDFHDSLPGLFLAFPLLLLAAFNGRLVGATTASAALAAVATWSTFTGHGPIAAVSPVDIAAADRASIVSEVLNLQLYIVVALLLSLPLAAVLGQREKLMVQLRETTHAAQQAARAKSQFLAVMSHEIRTPLTGVLGMADLLTHDPPPEKRRDYVARIRASGQHLVTLINDILDFSRIEAGRLELEAIDFTIAEVLEQVRSLLAPLAVERGLALNLDLEGASPETLKGDPTRIRQVLINLVGNALKFTERGRVTVTVSCRAMGDGREHFRFEVVDTGIGIPAAKRQALFDAFSQGDSSTTRRYGGSGLGLAISKYLVEAMGGEIGVDSVEGVGSRFWFALPLAVSQAAPPRRPPPPRLREQSPRRLLLVEDVEVNQILVADMLRARGHGVVVAANGQEALELVAREPFDLVLMDIQMPVMDGIEATIRIRRLPPPAGNIPVIALSANVMAEDVARYKAAGMNDTLAKPIEWPKLFEALAQYGGTGKFMEGDARTEARGS